MGCFIKPDMFTLRRAGIVDVVSWNEGNDQFMVSKRSSSQVTYP